MIPARILPTLTTLRVDIRVHFEVSLYYYCIPTLDIGKDCGTVQPANVISTSYGINEADLSVAYAIRQCNEYAKLGLMGVTFLFGSGDRGVAGGGGLCLNADGNANILHTVAALLA
jgi:subtilase family serine protease